jgi:hypothetical protein
MPVTRQEPTLGRFHMQNLPVHYLDDRFHETGIDEAMIDGTGSMLVDSSFGKC